MRTALRGLWIISVLGAASNAALGCTAPCSDSDSCGTYVPPDGGSGNHAGAAGNAGAPSGAGGTGATSGANAASGTGGASGSAGMIGGGAAGDGGAAGGSVPCDTTKDPSTESCLVNDDYAVFVAPSGKDDADGTKNAPLATLSKAAEIAGDKFVVVCNATYDEHVTITSGAHIYGGFKCTDWSAETGAPLFKPTTTGPALRIDTVTEPVTITGLKFEVGDATSVGETALAAIVNASPSVTFEGVTLKAGKGKAGAAGTLVPFTFPDPSSLNGNPETVAGSGGGGKTCMCQATLSSTGGVGGAPIGGGQPGSTGQPDNGAGKGGTPGSCGTTGTGDDGGNGPNSPPASGATTRGTVSSSGWTASGGSDGTNGIPGQGGGGGASRNDLGHGGGGGCGGCGGNGATAGKGGGGSIALLLINSPVQLNASALITADAGDGGAGHLGQLGQSDAGASGGVVSTFNSCGGGNGGKGGDGGASGGGAGGISVGIVWKGTTAPTVTETTTTTGKAGASGIGGVPGTNDGISGVKQDVLQVS